MSFADIVVGPETPVRATGRRRALAGAIVLDGRGRMLLLHRIEPSQWELPGGKVEPGEEPAHTAARELQEELAIRVGDLEEIGGTKFRQQGQRWSYTWFVAHEVDGRPRVAERERFDELSFWWMPDLTHRMHELSPNVRELVRAYFNGRITMPLDRTSPARDHPVARPA
jgi:8-oxo-dGTP diphosphatase